jgi:biopolymer transport protein ExbB/TolQ
MEFYNFVVNFFKEGGFFLYPLATIFVVGVAITIERTLYLTAETTNNRRIWGQVVPHINSGNFKQVIAITSKSKASIAMVLNYGIARLQHARRRDDIEKAMDESMLEIIPRMEKRTHYLSSLANIGMLIGLLGTVIGLIAAFASIAQLNPADRASALADSISLAMNNTASGLLVAITLLLTHMFLEAKTTKLIDSLEIAAVKFLNSVVERRQDETDDSAPASSRGRPAHGMA